MRDSRSARGTLETRLREFIAGPAEHPVHLLSGCAATGPSYRLPSIRQPQARGLAPQISGCDSERIGEPADRFQVDPGRAPGHDGPDRLDIQACPFSELADAPASALDQLVHPPFHGHREHHTLPRKILA